MPTQDTIYRVAWMLLHDEEFLRQNAHVRPEVFPRGALRYLVALSLHNWEAHRTLLTRSVIDMSTDNQDSALKRLGAVRDGVRDVYQDLSMLYFMDDASLPAVRLIGREWLERRQMLLSTEKANQAAEKGDLNTAHAVLQFVTLANTREPGAVLEPTSPDHLQTITVPSNDAFPTGFTDLDHLWHGGMRPSEIGMVVAPTGVGKSMALCFMAAEAMWKGAHVLYYTFELTPEQIRERTTLALLQSGKRSLHGTWQQEAALAAKRKGLNGVPPFRLDVRGDSMTWPALVGDLEDYKREFGKYPDLLLLDAADDIAPITKRERTYESLKDAFTFMRQLAHEKGLRIWSSGQLNKESVEKARVSLRHIGDAFAKAQRCHYVLGFAQTQQDKETAGGPKIQLFVLKDSHHGTSGSWLECDAKFGNGDNGYPGFEIENTHGMPIT